VGLPFKLIGFVPHAPYNSQSGSEKIWTYFPK